MPKILLVDDDIHLLEMLEMLCVHQGWDVTSKTTLEKPKKFFKELEPDILITDLVMRPVSGKDVIAAGREWNPSILVVVVSGMEEKDSRRAEVEALGVDFWLQKPFNLSDFNSFLGKIEASLKTDV